MPDDVLRIAQRLLDDGYVDNEPDARRAAMLLLLAHEQLSTLPDDPPDRSRRRARSDEPDDDTVAEEREATARAVERERQAIASYEATACKLDQLAATMEQNALFHDNRPWLDLRAIETAAHARKRAQSARDRATAARQRLRAEGFDPEP